MNKIIIFVAFVLVASAIYYAYDRYESFNEQLSSCVSSRNSITAVLERERDNCNTKTKNYEASLLDMVNDLNSFKSIANECDGRVAAEKQTCSVTLQKYLDASNQLKTCTSLLIGATSTTTIPTTTTTLVPTNSTK